MAAACRGWEGEADPDEAPIRLVLALGEGGGPEAVSASIRVDGPRLAIEGPGVAAEADSRTREARCLLEPGLDAADPGFVAGVIEPLLLFLLTRSGRTPVHAAGFVVGDLAILLAGPSGAGKSCLALAAHRAGLALLSDDMVFVQLRPVLRIWGGPRAIHLLPHDAQAATADGPVRLRNGKLKRAVPLEAGATAVTAGRAVLCRLERGDSVALEPIAGDEAGRGLSREPGFDLLQDEIEAALAALTAGRAWRLTLSADPAEAIDLLLRNLHILDAHPQP